MTSRSKATGSASVALTTAAGRDTHSAKAEILEFGRTYLRLKIGARTMKVAGETSPDGPGGPDFVVQLDSIEEWESPHANEEVSLADIGKITQLIEDAFEGRRLSVEFD